MGWLWQLFHTFMWHFDILSPTLRLSCRGRMFSKDRTFYRNFVQLFHIFMCHFDIWYLRLSCRGRMFLKGQNFSSEFAAKSWRELVTPEQSPADSQIGQTSYWYTSNSSQRREDGRQHEHYASKYFVFFLCSVIMSSLTDKCNPPPGPRPLRISEQCMARPSTVSERLRHYPISDSSLNVSHILTLSLKKTFFLLTFV